MKIIIIQCLFFACFLPTLLAEDINTVEGFAPEYVGEKVQIHAISDYLTMNTEKIAEGVVKKDSTFSLSFYNDTTRKIKVTIGKNRFHLYIQPKADYNVYVKNENPYGVNHPDGNDIEFFFIDLDTTDINYKILIFEDEVMNFIQKNYNHTTRSSTEFAEKLKQFKDTITEKYKDDSNKYFKIYVKYAIASLDNLSFKGSRNRYEKYDFYIKPETVWYHNDRYMEYILNYYDRYSYQISKDLNQAFYDGVIRSSPTLIMNNLGKDYALGNLRLRELIMLKMLRDVYQSSKYPQTNILTILDSISTAGLFEENRPIATHLKSRLTDLTPGSKMPEFSLPTVDNQQLTKSDFKGKHVYIQFVRAGAQKSEQDLHLIKALHKKFSTAVHFLTIIIPEDNQQIESQSAYIEKHGIEWSYSFLNKNNSFIENCKVINYPYYILMDAQGYVVSAPALSPRPNNEYETIEPTLRKIKKIREEEEEEIKKR